MKSQTFRPIHPGCIVQTEKTGAAAPVFLLRSVVPLRLVVQHGSGGGVDDVVILHAAGLELHLVVRGGFVKLWIDLRRDGIRRRCCGKKWSIALRAYSFLPARILSL